ncbi:unnamed protein product [Phytophthora fragariaefolia]|uniref:Unnamed protein product n=1 Tax=Phytophthora fragariaefolia TaxID=1490495 RepID=A0A9W6UEU5_9STRA|nr:unnamed protein product [Phytophthora fragariaefolia]
MRELVTNLEKKKSALVKRVVGLAGESKRVLSPLSPESCSPELSTSSSTVTTVSFSNYVQLTAQVEYFRRQNARMVEQIGERDLLYSVLRTGLLGFKRDEQNRGNAQFISLTHEQGMTCVRKTSQYINNARLRYANDKCFGDRPKIFGWSQYCKRQEASINFAVKKSLPNVTPRQLAATTWRFITDSDVLNTLGLTHLKTCITLVQKITDDVLVLDRRTEDRTHIDADGKMLILRTIYIAFRYESLDGRMTLALKTINLSLVKYLLREDEIWCDIFYWMHYSSDDTVGNSSLPMTVSEFGGANTYASEEYASSWLEEALFIATRWETLVFPPFLTAEIVNGT